MSWWSRIPDGQEEVGPFTVMLSIGMPETLVEAQDLQDPEKLTDSASVPARHWTWQESVTALLHAVFSRGGSVLWTFDDELFPLLWATARMYGEPAPAEHGARRPDAPLHVVVTERWYPTSRRLNDEPIDSIRAYEATGAVRILPEPASDLDDSWMPGRRFGIVLWPDSNLAADVARMEQAERLAVLRWADRPLDQPWLSRADQWQVEGDAPALQHLFASHLDEWLGRAEPGKR